MNRYRLTVHSNPKEVRTMKKSDDGAHEHKKGKESERQ
jgi:hypothetical protein